MAVSARFGFDDILGNETVDFAVLQSNFDIADQNAAHLGLANVFTNLTTFQRGVSTDIAHQARVSGDANPRFTVAADGTHRWGIGSAPSDTNLYRVSAGILRTDGILQVGQALSVGSGSPTSPAHGFLSDTDSGFYSIANDQVGLSLGGIVRQSWFTGGVRYRSDSQIQWSATADPTAGADTFLYRLAAATLRTDNNFDVGGIAFLRGETRFGAANPSSMAANTTYPTSLGNKTTFWDNGNGTGFGIGMNVGELALFGGTIGFRRQGGWNDGRTGWFDSNAGAFFATTFNGTFVGNIQAGALVSNMHIQDGVVHDGWVRNATTGTGIYNNAVGLGIAFDGAGPYFYAGANGNERFQSRARSDGIHRPGIYGPNGLFDCNSFDSFYMTGGGNYTLPDITPLYGRKFKIKNIAGADCNVFVTNGGGLYLFSWNNPFLMHHGDSIDIEAVAAFGGWIIG